MSEMIELWKKNRNMFEVLYGWFLAKACLYVWQSYLSSLLYFQLLIVHSLFKNEVLYFSCTMLFSSLEYLTDCQ